MKISKVHIGDIIRMKLKEQGRTQRQLARQLGLSRNTVYSMLRQGDMNTKRLFQLSKALNYNFFELFTMTSINHHELKTLREDNQRLTTENQQLQAELKQARHEMALLREMNAVMKKSLEVVAKK